MKHRRTSTRTGIWKSLVQAGIGAVALVFVALLGLIIGLCLSLKPWG